MIELDDFRPSLIDLAISFKLLGSTTSRPIFLQLIARPINLGGIYPILYQNLFLLINDQFQNLN